MNIGTLDKVRERYLCGANHVVGLLSWGLSTPGQTCDGSGIVEQDNLQGLLLQVVNQFGIVVHLIGHGIFEDRALPSLGYRVPLIEVVELVVEEWRYLHNVPVLDLQIFAPDYLNGDQLLPGVRTGPRGIKSLHVLNLAPLSEVPGSLRYGLAHPHLELDVPDHLVPADAHHAYGFLDDWCAPCRVMHGHLPLDHLPQVDLSASEVHGRIILRDVDVHL